MRIKKPKIKKINLFRFRLFLKKNDSTETNIGNTMIINISNLENEEIIEKIKEIIKNILHLVLINLIIKKIAPNPNNNANNSKYGIIAYVLKEISKNNKKQLTKAIFSLNSSSTIL